MILIVPCIWLSQWPASYFMKPLHDRAMFAIANGCFHSFINMMPFDIYFTICCIKSLTSEPGQLTLLEWCDFCSHKSAGKTCTCVRPVRLAHKASANIPANRIVQHWIWRDTLCVFYIPRYSSELRQVIALILQQKNIMQQRQANMSNNQIDNQTKLTMFKLFQFILRRIALLYLITGFYSLLLRVLLHLCLQCLLWMFSCTAFVGLAVLQAMPKQACQKRGEKASE